MKTIPHGITIGDIHTWRDLYLIPVCRPIVQPPTEKTMTLEVEGMSGVADLSHGLTGYPVFSDREGNWQFYIDTDRWREENNFWGPVGNLAYQDIMARLKEKMARPFQTRIVLDDDPLFYWVGRIWVSEAPNTGSTPTSTCWQRTETTGCGTPFALRPTLPP